MRVTTLILSGLQTLFWIVMLVALFSFGLPGYTGGWLGLVLTSGLV
jgi:hypothetical protein